MGGGCCRDLDLRSCGNIAIVLADIAGFMLTQDAADAAGGDYSGALTLQGAANALFESAGLRYSPAEMAAHDPRIARLPGLLEDPAARAYFEAGRAMGPEDALAFVRRYHEAHKGDKAPVPA